MNVNVSCRDLKELNPLVKIQLEVALNDLKGQGINPLVTETYRTKERQYFLLGKGRTVNECVNMGVPKSKAKKYSNPNLSKVTWTINSIHMTRGAVDLVPQRIVNGKLLAVYDVKDKETQAIIKTMSKYGFEAGANWSHSPDSPHFQIANLNNSYKTYREKNNNPFVTKTIQQALKNKKFYNGKIDGIWGKKTTQAIKDFKKSLNWKVNGVVGVRALKKILSFL